MDYNKRITINGRGLTILGWLKFLKQLADIKFLEGDSFTPDKTIYGEEEGKKNFFGCAQAEAFNKAANEKRPANSQLNIHAHNPTFTKKDLQQGFKVIAEEVKKEIEKTPMKVVSKEPKKIVYGDSHDQIIYNWNDKHKKWDISAVGQPNATIVDPDGAIIEISKGHIHISTIDGYKGQFMSSHGHSPSAHAHGKDADAQEDPHKGHVHGPNCNHEKTHVR